MRSFGAGVWFTASILAACSQGGTPSEAELTSATRQEISAGNHLAAETGGDNSAPSAIVITWDAEQTEKETPALSATVTNTTANALSVTLSLTGVLPNGDAITRPIGSRQVPASSSVPVQVPAALLPVQSEGLASSVQMSGTYRAPALLAPGQAPMSREIQEVSPALYLTSDIAAGTFVARESASQARVNSTASTSAFARLARVSIYDVRSGKVADATEALKGAGRNMSKPLIEVLDRGPESAPPSSAGVTP